jgi:hypothetical protein
VTQSLEVGENKLQNLTSGRKLHELKSNLNSAQGFSLVQAKPKSSFCTADELRFHSQETKNTIVSLQQNSGQWGGVEKYSGDFVPYNMPELF